VIHTVRKGFPLNTMYWVVADGGYELMADLVLDVSTGASAGSILP